MRELLYILQDKSCRENLTAESLNELEDQDLDTLVTDLRSESTADASNGDAADEDATSGASKEDESATNLPPASTASETPQHTVNPSQNDLPIKKESLLLTALFLISRANPKPRPTKSSSPWTK